MKSVGLVCTTGLVTPVMMREKVKKFLKSKGINAEIKQYRVAEVSLKMKKPDVIVSTTTMPPELEKHFKVISGLPLLTGVGEEEIFAELERVLAG